MKKPEYLFYLIKSMTRNEKKNFRLYSSVHSHGDVNQYISLFDAIDSQKVYNEKILIDKLNDYFKPKDFPAVKKYLYSLLLKILKIIRMKAQLIIN